MPLGEREGDTGESKFCGVITDFTYNLQEVLVYNLAVGFDFVVTPLINPEFRPTLAKWLPDIIPYVHGSSDYSVDPVQWRDFVIGQISSWIDLDSEDETLRVTSEAILKRELERASYLSLKACLLPAPKGTSCVNYARCVKQILQGLQQMKLWVRIPFGMSDDDSGASSTNLVDSWKIWNSFHQLCDHDSQLMIALDIIRILPSENAKKRWYGEPVIAAIIDSDIFLAKTYARGNNSMYLSKRHQKLITDLFDHSIKIIISGNHVQPRKPLDPFSSADSKRHPLGPCLNHIRYLYKRMDPLTEREILEFGIRDFIHPPSQPLKTDMEALTYSDFEKDIGKYSKYESAICQALLDRVPNGKASEVTAVLIVVGAGRGPLVRASVNAAKGTGRMLRVYALEENTSAAMALKELIKSEVWDNIVTVISTDMRVWFAPEKADILVSDFLGSFGDNELSPECIDRLQRFLKKDGISIPSSYTSFLQPLTASKLHSDIKEREDILQFEIPCDVKLHNVFRVAPTQQVFTFHHPNRFDEERNQRHKKLHFLIPKDPGSAMVHGFAGYFDAILYKDVHLGTKPSTATPNVFTWFPIFFPLKTPFCVNHGSTLEVHFWRRCDPTRVWYEWCVTSPSVSPIHNCNGRSHCMKL